MQFSATALTSLAFAVAVAGCGGGGSTASTVPAPTLSMVALSPLTAQLAPGGTQQLTVTATYSDGSTKVLPAAGETFKSSDMAVATITASGIVTVAPNAANESKATITATDVASGRTTAAANSTVITVVWSGPGPTAQSVAAATATAQNNALCGTTLAPFYWEIGDKSGVLASASVGSGSNGQVLASTVLQVASASKLIYATYVAQIRGALSAFTSDDVNFLHFTSGYTYMGDSTTSATCPHTLTPDTVNECLTQTNGQGQSFSAQDPGTTGKFDYDSGHMENHASQFTALGNVDVATLGTTVASQLGSGVTLTYSEPLMSGGVNMSAAMYGLVLRHILDGSLFMNDLLGTHPVCTLASATCTAGYSPLPEAWHYSIGHWVEDDPNSNGDGAFSSPGAFGFYPWIDASKAYYGVVAREHANGAYESAECGRLIRRAWMTGVEQTGSIPSP